MNNAAPLLQVRQVAASRPGESGALQRVLQETTLKVEAGEILAVVGPSGSGKSTLLRLLNRLLEAESGEILLAGVNISNFPPAELRACIPLVSQKPFLFPGTVMENLQAPARLRRTELPDSSDPSLQVLLELCHVDPAWLDRDARKLSVGQQQRVCLARAMVGPCQVLLLDEPTSALDRPTADQMALTFRQLAREKNLAIIFCYPRPAPDESLCRSCYLYGQWCRCRRRSCKPASQSPGNGRSASLSRLRVRR